MATYTHDTPARYTNANPRNGGTFVRAAKGYLSRLRPTSAASVNAKRVFGSDWPKFGGSTGTAFLPVSGIVTRTYRGGTTATGSKSRTR